MCTNKDIQELLPAYLEQGLDQSEKNKVEDHLRSCEDCALELALLRTIADDPVPDPGEAFWAAMPGDVHRAVQEQKTGRTTFALSRLLDRLILPRWALATAVVGAVAIGSWLLVRPTAMDIVPAAMQAHETSDENGTPDPVNVAELSSTELAAATQWAENAFTPIREAVSEDASDDTPQDISEDLNGLSPRELDRLFEMLKKKEQETRDRIRKGPAGKKNLG